MTSLSLVWDLIAVDHASATFRKVGAEAEGAHGMVGKFAAVLGGAALVGALGDAIKKASDFQGSMLLLQTQAGASAEAVKKISPAVLSLAGQTAQAPEALATSMYHAYSVTQDMGKSLDITRAAAKLATISHSDLEQTTNALTSAVASNIPGIHNMNDAIGMLNATVGAGDMKMTDLNQALQSGLLTTVSQYGLSMRDVSAALATFGDVNVRGANAATMLRMGVQAMAVPVKNGDAILKALGITTGQTDQALGKYGITGKKLADDMRTGGLNKAITDLHQHLVDAGVQTNQYGEIVTAAFGKKAGPAVSILLGQFDRLQQKYTAVDKSMHTFNAEWDATTKTASFQMTALKDHVEAVAISIGTVLLPYVTEFAKWINDHVLPAISNLGGRIKDFVSSKAFQDWWGNVKTQISQFADAVGKFLQSEGFRQFLKDAWKGVQLLWGALGDLYNATKSVLDYLSKNNKWVGEFVAIILGGIAGVGLFAAGAWAVNSAVTAWTAAQIILNAVLDANPIGLVIVALAGLTAGVIWAYDHFKVFRDGVNWWADAIKTAFNWVKNNWPALLAILTGPIGIAVDIIAGKWGSLVNTFKDPVNFLIRYVMNDGIIKAINWVTHWVGIAPIDPIPPIGSGGSAPSQSSGSVPAGFIGPVQRRATGGMLVGPGTGTSDSIPFWGSHGEFIVNAKATAENRALLEAINGNAGPATKGGMPAFAGGGFLSGFGDFLSGLTGWITDPIGHLKSLAMSAVHGIDSNPFGHLLVQSAESMVGLAGKKISDLIGGFMGGGAGGSGVPGSVGSGVERLRPVVDTVLRMLGQPTNLDNGVLSLISHESGGNATAVNRTDSNWVAGHPSVGDMQLIAGTFARFAGPFRNTGPFLYGVSTSDIANVYAGTAYALQTYGAGMLAAGGRHDASGHYVGYLAGTNYVPGDGFAYLHRGEAVIPAAKNQGAPFQGGGPITVTIIDRDGTFIERMDGRIESALTHVTNRGAYSA